MLLSEKILQLVRPERTVADMQLQTAQLAIRAVEQLKGKGLLPRDYTFRHESIPTALKEFGHGLTPVANFLENADPSLHEIVKRIGEFAERTSADLVAKNDSTFSQLAFGQAVLEFLDRSKLLHTKESRQTPEEDANFADLPDLDSEIKKLLSNVPQSQLAKLKEDPLLRSTGETKHFAAPTGAQTILGTYEGLACETSLPVSEVYILAKDSERLTGQLKSLIDFINGHETLIEDDKLKILALLYPEKDIRYYSEPAHQGNRLKLQVREGLAVLPRAPQFHVKNITFLDASGKVIQHASRIRIREGLLGTFRLEVPAGAKNVHYELVENSEKPSTSPATSAALQILRQLLIGEFSSTRPWIEAKFPALRALRSMLSPDDFAIALAHELSQERRVYCKLPEVLSLFEGWTGDALVKFMLDLPDGTCSTQGARAALIANAMGIPAVMTCGPCMKRGEILSPGHMQNLFLGNEGGKIFDGTAQDNVRWLSEQAASIFDGFSQVTDRTVGEAARISQEAHAILLQQEIDNANIGEQGHRFKSDFHTTSDVSVNETILGLRQHREALFGLLRSIQETPKLDFSLPELRKKLAIPYPVLKGRMADLGKIGADVQDYEPVCETMTWLGHMLTREEIPLAFRAKLFAKASKSLYGTGEYVDKCRSDGLGSLLSLPVTLHALGRMFPFEKTAALIASISLPFRSRGSFGTDSIGGPQSRETTCNTLALYLSQVGEVSMTDRGGALLYATLFGCLLSDNSSSSRRAISCLNAAWRPQNPRFFSSILIKELLASSCVGEPSRVLKVLSGLEGQAVPGIARSHELSTNVKAAFVRKAWQGIGSIGDFLTTVEKCQDLGFTFPWGLLTGTIRKNFDKHYAAHPSTINLPTMDYPASWYLAKYGDSDGPESKYTKYLPRLRELGIIEDADIARWLPQKDEREIATVVLNSITPKCLSKGYVVILGSFSHVTDWPFLRAAIISPEKERTPLGYAIARYSYTWRQCLEDSCLEKMALLNPPLWQSVASMLSDTYCPEPEQYAEQVGSFVSFTLRERLPKKPREREELLLRAAGNIFVGSSEESAALLEKLTQVVTQSANLTPQAILSANPRTQHLIKLSAAEQDAYAAATLTVLVCAVEGAPLFQSGCKTSLETVPRTRFGHEYWRISAKPDATRIREWEEYLIKSYERSDSREKKRMGRKDTHRNLSFEHNDDREFVGTREYSAGDDMRFVDWSVAARHEKYFVKLYSPPSTRTRPSCVVYDVELGKGRLDELFSLLQSLQNEHIPTTLYVMGRGDCVELRDAMNPKARSEIPNIFAGFFASWDLILEQEDARKLKTDGHSGYNILGSNPRHLTATPTCYLFVSPQNLRKTSIVANKVSERLVLMPVGKSE
jgi:hypothetical protein